MRSVMVWMMFAIFSGMIAMPVQAEEENILQTVHITHDQATLKKGLHVFTDICMGCHSMRYMTWKNLMDYPEIGLTRAEVDELREDAPLTASLKTQLTPADAKASYGTVPPDLSLIARAREGHGAYVYSVLTGYEHDASGRIPDGNYNLYFHGHRIAMNDPLGWFDHEKEDEADLREQARDIASFLVFVGDPHQIERRNIGKYVISFLVLLTLIFWWLKHEVWRDVKLGVPETQFRGRDRRSSGNRTDQDDKKGDET